MIGKTLGQYRIDEKIGAGGMGEVYRAHHPALGRDVAVKVLPPGVGSDPERCARFEKEARALAALSHPSILSVYDFGSQDDRYFIVTELLDGETLAERLKTGPIPPRKAVEIAAQVADGLFAAHSRGLIHRDIKPANIFITTDGRARILDFGLARHVQDETGGADLSQSPTVQTDPGTVMGTVGYMSPEQVRGEVVDSRTDIFSLGSVLYEMLCGERAFDGDSAAEVIGAILRDDPPPMRDRDRSMPESLERVVQHCLEKNPEERFQSARDLAFALSNVSSTSSSAIDAVLPRRARSGRRVVLAAAAVMGWVLAIALFIGNQKQMPEPASPPRLTTIAYSGRDWGPDVSPAGDIIAFTSDRDGISRIWLKQVNGGGEAPLTAGPDDLPRFSPDGTQLLFTRESGSGRDLYRTNIVGSQPRKLLDNVIEADWSPDGDRVAYTRLRAQGGDNVAEMGIADAQTGESRVIAEVANRAWYGIRWSPRGDLVALNETSLTGNVAEESYIDMIDVETGDVDRMALTDWGGPYTPVDWAPSGRSFVVAQAADMLAHASGAPGLVMEYDLDSGTRIPLFWSLIRIPRSGWGVSSIAVLDRGQIVVDSNVLDAQLREYGSPGLRSPKFRRVLTNSMGRDRQPAYSPDGNRLVFSSNRSGNVDLWTVDLRDGAMRQLTDDPSDDWDPGFTPDGRQLLWSSDRSGNLEVWIANADGSRARQVSADGKDAENPTMTRDGKWIVYASASDEKRGIWRVRPDGSEAALIVPGAHLLPDCSRDGRYALFITFQNLDFVVGVVEIETAELVPFEIELQTTERHLNVTFGRARWMPDDRSIMFIAQDEKGRTGVFAQDFVPGEDTSDTLRPVVGFSHEFITESLGVSPDGGSIVISAMYDQRFLQLADGFQLRFWK